jgi:ATP-binding cassette, subfamily F, member 3
VALQSFAGGMLIVSHDRHLIKTVADSLWLVADGKLTVFEGDLDDYQQWLRSRGKSPPASASTQRASRQTTPKTAAKTGRREAAGGGARSRGRLGELRREIEHIEKRIAAIALQRTIVEEELCKDPMHSGLQAQHAELTRDAASMETQWLEVGTTIETIEAAEAQIGESG